MRIALGLFVAAIFSFAGCGDTTASAPADLAATAIDLATRTCSGGPVGGAIDRHCYGDGGGNFHSVDPGQCSADAGAGAGGFGDTLYNSAGNDDGCKYLVSFTTAGGLCAGSSATFTASLKDAVKMQPIAHADNVRAEVFDTTTRAPVNTAAAATSEIAAGVYTIGPITFPASGHYTIRFHFYERCADTPSSPRGHVAFFVDVP